MKKDKEIFRMDHVTKTVAYQEQFHINFYSQYPVTEKPSNNGISERMLPLCGSNNCIQHLLEVIARKEGSSTVTRYAKQPSAQQEAIIEKAFSITTGKD